jgi:hypothetical protein
VVLGIFGVLDVPYGENDSPPIGRFRQQIVIQGLGGAFSDRGDSGSLVLEKATNRPVGLLFAGGTGTDGVVYTFANPILEVLDRLKIDRFINKKEPVLGPAG